MDSSNGLQDDFPTGRGDLSCHVYLVMTFREQPTKNKTLQRNKLDHADVPQWEGMPKEYGGPIEAARPREATVACAH